MYVSPFLVHYLMKFCSLTLGLQAQQGLRYLVFVCVCVCVCVRVCASDALFLGHRKLIC